MNELLNAMQDTYHHFECLYDDDYDRPANECIDYRRAFNAMLENFGMSIGELKKIQYLFDEPSEEEQAKFWSHVDELKRNEP